MAGWWGVGWKMAVSGPGSQQHPRLLLRFFFMNPLPFPQRGQVQPADWPGLSRELTGPVAKRSVHLLPRVRLLCGAGPGPRVLIKSQPGLPVHPGKCRCVCASWVTSLQNAELLLITVHPFIVFPTGGEITVYLVTTALWVTEFIVLETSDISDVELYVVRHSCLLGPFHSRWN